VQPIYPAARDGWFADARCCSGKLFYAEIGDNPQKIIDLGTGTGIWALDGSYRVPPQFSAVPGSNTDGRLASLQSQTNTPPPKSWAST
jgi:hypothetical protein